MSDKVAVVLTQEEAGVLVDGPCMCGAGDCGNDALYDCVVDKVRLALSRPEGSVWEGEFWAGGPCSVTIPPRFHNRRVLVIEMPKGEEGRG